MNLGKNSEKILGQTKNDLVKNNQPRNLKVMKDLSSYFKQIFQPSIYEIISIFKKQQEQIINKIVSQFQSLLRYNNNQHQKDIQNLRDKLYQKNNIVRSLRCELQQVMLLLSQLNRNQTQPKKQQIKESLKLPNLSNLKKNTFELPVIQQQNTYRTIPNSQRQEKIEQIASITIDKPQLQICRYETILKKNNYRIEQQQKSIQVDVHLSEPICRNPLTEQTQITTDFDDSINENPKQINKLLKNYSMKLNIKRFFKNENLNSSSEKSFSKKKPQIKSQTKLNQNKPIIHDFKKKCSKEKEINTNQRKNSKIKYQSFIDDSPFLLGDKKIQIRYEGAKKDKVRHGKGTLYYSNGLCYEGDFKNGIRDGYGTLRFNFIEIYNGQWKNDKLNGNGKLRNCSIILKKTQKHNQDQLSKWVSYVGQFKNNKFQGKGLLSLQGGESYEGQFRNGQACGYGILFKKAGIRQQGLWTKNCFVKDVIQNIQF